MDDIFTKRDRENCPQEKEQQSLLRTAYPPGKNGLLILTRLLPSSEHSNTHFCRTPPTTTLR
jgi:hypothetical protein